jgi:RNA polymerase sigma factor (sigma-70 family)
MESADDALLEGLRPVAFAVAYRMLGAVADAEDVVQEALLRVYRELRDGRPIDSPPAFVTTVTTRLAIDRLRSAQVRREHYVGEWLPEPLVAAAADGPASPGFDPARRAEMADSLSLAFLVLLEQLSPEQRAVLLLRDVFDYGYGEIAAIVGTSEANARQLAARARRHVDDGRPRFESSRERRDELARRFFAAAGDGDLAALEELLAADVVLHGDGGGRAPALAGAVHGRGHVARTLLAWWRAGARIDGAAVRPVSGNGQPGALLLAGDGRLISVMSLDIWGGAVQSIRSIVNPDKLAHIGPVADLRGLLRPRPG